MAALILYFLCELRLGTVPHGIYPASSRNPVTVSVTERGTGVYSSQLLYRTTVRAEKPERKKPRKRHKSRRSVETERFRRLYGDAKGAPGSRDLVSDSVQRVVARERCPEGRG